MSCLFSLCCPKLNDYAGSAGDDNMSINTLRQSPALVITLETIQSIYKSKLEDYGLRFSKHPQQHHKLSSSTASLNNQKPPPLAKTASLVSTGTPAGDHHSIPPFVMIRLVHATRGILYNKYDIGGLNETKSNLRLFPSSSPPDPPPSSKQTKQKQRHLQQDKKVGMTVPPMDTIKLWNWINVTLKLSTLFDTSTTSKSTSSVHLKSSNSLISCYKVTAQSFLILCAYPHQTPLIGDTENKEMDCSSSVVLDVDEYQVDDSLSKFIGALQKDLQDN